MKKKSTVNKLMLGFKNIKDDILENVQTHKNDTKNTSKLNI